MYRTRVQKNSLKKVEKLLESSSGAFLCVKFLVRFPTFLILHLNPEFPSSPYSQAGNRHAP